MAAATPESGAGSVAAQVLILANVNDADSLAIARHYAEARQVPESNVIALPMPTNETITWTEFVPMIWEPLMRRLVYEHWIDAIGMDSTDPVGRRKYAVNGHRIAALVVCRGVPLRIAHDPSLYADVLPYTRHVEFRTNAAAVDAELSLLAMPNHPINAFIPNPLFQNDHPTPFERQQVIEVSRLDGPTAADALALVDHALAAERDGLLGRAYIDLSDRDEIGNRWLESTASQLKDLGFDTDVDRAPAILPREARIDAPVLYFGWYAGDLGGVFGLPDFRFPPGAIALHIHSYSAATLRSATTGWTGPLVARGVTATVGNVYEPYLQLTHRPDLLVRALTRGATLGDAAYFALQALSWQEVLIGDPLYRPFAVSLAQQLARLEQLPPELAGYAVIRKVNLLDQTGHRGEATALLRRDFLAHPRLALGVALARRLREAGDSTGAGQALSVVADATTYQTTDWALAREAAEMLHVAGRSLQAVTIWRALLDNSSLPVDLRRLWLPDAIAAARAANDAEQASTWQRELTPEPPAAAGR